MRKTNDSNIDPFDIMENDSYSLPRNDLEMKNHLTILPLLIQTQNIYHRMKLRMTSMLLEIHLWCTIRLN